MAQKQDVCIEHFFVHVQQKQRKKYNDNFEYYDTSEVEYNDNYDFDNSYKIEFIWDLLDVDDKKWVRK